MSNEERRVLRRMSAENMHMRVTNEWIRVVRGLSALHRPVSLMRGLPEPRQSPVLLIGCECMGIESQSAGYEAARNDISGTDLMERVGKRTLRRAYLIQQIDVHG